MNFSNGFVVFSLIFLFFRFVVMDHHHRRRKRLHLPITCQTVVMVNQKSVPFAYAILPHKRLGHQKLVTTAFV
jgi:hypothetical protein